jgi:two-component system phosphate regulon response regulator OmpR
MSFHILVIDDDNRIRELLEKYLIRNDFVVSTSSNVKEARILMQKYAFDLIIADYMMPEESGVSFLINLRKENDMVPVIMLTALGEIENKIEGLTAGADDYLPKPFEPKELILRIKNILKRTKEAEKNNSNFAFGNYNFDLNKNELYNGDILIKLTDTEIKLLKIFYNNLNIVLSREKFCELCNEISERSVDVLITRLRKKIESNPKNPKFLKTIRNKGYVFYI